MKLELRRWAWEEFTKPRASIAFFCIYIPTTAIIGALIQEYGWWWF